MRRGWIVLLLVVVAIAAGIGGYNVGLSEGIEETGRAGGVVRVYGHGHGFFPFGFILFPLFIFGIFALIKGAFWGGHGHGRGHGHFEDWHRRQHQEGGGTPATGETGCA